MISKPNVNIALVSANAVLDIGGRRDLIVAQNPGTSTTELITGIEDKTQAELDALFGASSYIRVMVQDWLDANQVGNNIKAELDVLALKPDGSAVAATATIVFAGTATAAGTIAMSILSEKKYTQNISIASGVAAADVATAVKTAFASVAAPFTVDNSTVTVTITASDLGTLGNNYGLKFSGLPAGITATLTGFAAVGTGSGTPVVTGIFDLVGGTRYQGVLWPEDQNANISEVVDFLDARFNSADDILDGVAFHGFIDTLANDKIEVNALNSQSLVVGGNNISNGTEIDGPEIIQPIDWTWVEFMAVRARRLTEGASISAVVVTNASGDQFGGIPLASLPYFNTPIKLTALTVSAQLFDTAEQIELATAGYSVIGSNKAGLSMLTGTIVTTYKKDTAGNDDISFRFLNFVDIASTVREFIFVNLKSDFKQSRLTDGDVIAGRDIVNADTIKATFLGYMALLADLAVIQGGREVTKNIEENTNVTVSVTGRSATINSILVPVGQLENLPVTLQLSFTS